ncbi:hypothetical protein Tdes44962_MAKER07131 [Teratosphaeria destructans]|uniref:Uncharacterized protein n=1 Tax=Teratosphaeria destructans TaxID=418781 RepID=A0A9W7T099_9PEZI|nr:hypothetical protein Tdes44962_MAKER07131 [Teratosphaeria destructans]
MLSVTRMVEALNFHLPIGRWQLFEISDLWIAPAFIRHRVPETLVAQWTKRLPLIQSQSLAELAGDALVEALDGIDDLETVDWTVIDFCSGAGGPIPRIEMLVNHGRKAHQQRPIPFKLSDTDPNAYLDSWMELSARSIHLSFIPNPVNAASPPFSAISATTAGDKDLAARQGFISNGSKVFRLYCQSFHHFDDEMAKKVLRSTLETSDAFAIIELQERTAGALAMKVFEALLLFITTFIWFWHSNVHLLFTYALPVLRTIYLFDGLISCIRTRTFDELVDVIGQAQGMRHGDASGMSNRQKLGSWEFSHTRTLHTWPVGYMSVIVGRKVEKDKG